MFGFGLKLKSKPKPTISAARRPRDHVAETSQKLDAIGQAANAKQTSNENLSQSQNTNSEKSEKITPTINCAGTVIELAHPESCHLEFKKIDSKRGEEISTKSDASNSPSVVSLQNSSSSVINNDRTSSHPKINLDRDVHNNSEQNIPTTPLSTENEVLTTVDNGTEGTCSDLGNSAIVVKDANTVEGSSENVNQDSIRQKSVPFKPKLFPKKNKFVPNLRVVRKTDSNKSISISPQKNSDSINSESDTSVMTAECESHVDSDDITSIAAESLLEMSKTIPGDDLQNQSTTNEQPQGKEPPPAQPIQSSHQVSSTKEPVTSSKPILEKIADKENTICNDDNQIHNPGNILQNSKKKKPRAQGTFLQMTIEAKKELNEKLKDGVLDKSKLIMRDLILYNPTSNPMPVKSKTKCIKEEKKCKSDGKSIMDEILSEQSVDDVEATRDSDAGTMPVPKLKVGPDGKIILDSSSLVIETTGTEKSRTDLQNSELVEENEFSGFKYRKRRARRNDWSPEETVLFYKALNDLGADFSLMQALFPSRTRRDLKLKFKKEERCNLSLVDKAMTHVGKFNFEALKEELTRDRAERTKRQEEQVRVKEEAKKMLKLQKMEAKIKEKQLKAENSRKLKEERCNSKENENKNSRKGVKRSKKMPATEEYKPKKRRSKKEKILDSDCDSDDNRHLDCSDESMDSCNNDNDNMCYDTIFKTTKSGRKPRVRNKIKEECERNEIKEALKIKKVSEILRDQIESVVNMNVEEEKEQQSESVSVDSVQEIEICLFEEPSNQFEESSHVQNDLVKEVQNSESKVKSILNLGSRLPNQNLPETIKIVEELTKGIPLSTVDVNGVMCKIIALNDGNACGSSTFQVRDSREDTTNSNRCFRLETVSDGAGTDCQNYVISYSENGGIVDLSSQMVTDEEPNPNRPHSDHSYCISKEFVTPDENNTELAHESYVVLKPNECVEIYNDS